MGLYNAVPPPADDGVSLAESPQAAPQPPRQATPQTPSRHPSRAAATTPIDIEAWTISALQSLSVSPIARGTGSPLTIPLDEAAAAAQQSRAQRLLAERAAAHAEAEADGTGATAASPAPAHRSVTIAVDTPRDPIRRPPSRRDSQKRREALLKGNEGSRQRRRWENDRLIHVPNVQPPLPSDFAPHPTHPVNRVPYQLAAFWDREVNLAGGKKSTPGKPAAAVNSPSSAAGGGATLRQRHDDKYLAQQARRKKLQMANGSATGLGAGLVPRDLREYAKRSPAVKNWVRHLEEPVRNFAREHRQQQQQQQQRDAADDRDPASDMDSEDEEIVFVGRKNMPSAMAAGRHGWKSATVHVEDGEGGAARTERGVVFDELGDDDSAAFKRWLAHSISGYYGLESRSVTTGSPARRVVYVGAKPPGHGSLYTTGRDLFFGNGLPRPLWEVC